MEELGEFDLGDALDFASPGIDGGNVAAKVVALYKIHGAAAGCRTCFG